MAHQNRGDSNLLTEDSPLNATQTPVQNYQDNTKGAPGSSTSVQSTLISRPPKYNKMKRVPFWRRFHALCMLQIHIQRRKYLQNICLILFPLVILLLPIIVSVLAFVLSLASPGDSPRQVNSGEYFFSTASNYDCCDRQLQVNHTVCKAQPYVSPFQTRSFGSPNDYMIVDSTAPGDDQLGTGAFSQKDATGYFASVPRFKEQRTYNSRHGWDMECGYSPAFDKRNSTSDQQLDVILEKSAMDYATCVTKQRNLDPYSSNLVKECLNSDFVGHGVNVRRLKSSELKMDASIFSSFPQMTMRTLMSGLIRKVSHGNNTFSPRLGNYRSVADPSGFSIAGFADICVLFLYPVVACFLMPLFASTLIEDRNSGVLSYMELYGVTLFDETVVRTISDMTLFLVYMFINHIFGAIFQIRVLQFSWWMMLILNPLFGYIQVMAAYTIAPIFKNPGQATVVGYLVILITSCIASLLNMLLFTSHQLPPWWYLIFPLFTYVRGLSLAIVNCNSGGFVKPDLSQFFICIAIMVVQAILLTVTASGILTWLPKYLYTFAVRTYYRLTASESEKTGLLYSQDDDDIPVGDDEVIRERERIQNGQFSQDDILVIDGLTKVFGYGKKRKVAVNNVYMGCKRGSCTGLIGSNGSGKTTTISMLIGLLKPTKGTAYVCGYDINTQMSQVKKCIGVLPQFEILFPTLTVEEHLIFYGRLRGIPFSDEKKHAKDLLAEVGLEEARRRSSKNLSGGMRRRLGLAIAMCGSPPLLLLDEASSGLDPNSACGIWDLILEAKKSRCVVLTSHSMHEVETLCERIGMMANGSLVCAGDLLDLRKKYTDGYKLKITIHPQHEERARAYMSETVPFAEYVQKPSEGNLLYSINSDSMKLSVLFRQMQVGERSKHGIKDWSLDEGGILEEVFLKFAQGHDDEV